MYILYIEGKKFCIGKLIQKNKNHSTIQNNIGIKIKKPNDEIFLSFDGNNLQKIQKSIFSIKKDINVYKLWELSKNKEFDLDQISNIYFKRLATDEEKSAILICLLSYNKIFKKLENYKFAPLKSKELEILKIKIQEEENLKKKEFDFVTLLNKGIVPDAIKSDISKIIYNPNKDTPEYKSIVNVAKKRKLTYYEFLYELDLIKDLYNFHVENFIKDKNKYLEISETVDKNIEEKFNKVDAFSVDDNETIEIDDAFSVTKIDNLITQIGIHIANPTNGVKRNSKIDICALERMSTVYLPDRKITMLPRKIIDEYSLRKGKIRPVLSLYLHVNKDFLIKKYFTQIENINIKENLDLDKVEEVFNEKNFKSNNIFSEHFEKLIFLYNFVKKQDNLLHLNDQVGKEEKFFKISDNKLFLKKRKRGSPIDIVVSGLMNIANFKWSGFMYKKEASCIYRYQKKNKSGFSLNPESHEGLKREFYAWFTSPLRRYIDLENQRQLLDTIKKNAIKDNHFLKKKILDFYKINNKNTIFTKKIVKYCFLKYIKNNNEKIFKCEPKQNKYVELINYPVRFRIPDLCESFKKEINIKISDINLLDVSAKIEVLY